MAEGGSLEELTDMLTCSMCLSKFVEPRTLPCLHTFCLKCLEQFVEALKNFKQLKCPLCNEQHIIPSEGVKAFRQDFRIKNLVELENKKAIPNTTSKELKIDICSKHTGLELQFCCKNRQCKRTIICAKCWEETHNQHDVVPLKQEYNDIISKVKKAQTSLLQIELNTQKVLKVKEELESNRVEMRSRVAKRVQEYQGMLTELADEVLSAVEKKTNEELRKATAEIDLLLIIQEELKTADIDLNSEIRNVLEKGRHLSDNIKDIQTSIEEWEFKTSKPVVPVCSVSAADMVDFDKTFAGITITEEVFTSKQKRTETKKISFQNKIDVSSKGIL